MGIQNWNDLQFFQQAHDKPLLEFIKDEINQGKKILPAYDDIFNALTYTPFQETKVIILGQDPYPNPEHAHGLAFSIPKDCVNIPKSLMNIFKELENDLGIQKKNPNLTEWAKQGVLLLNTVLTLEAGQSNSHKGKGWESLTKEVIEVLNTQKQHLVFILWGNFAKKIGKKIDRTRHCVIESAHPSPLSSYRGFFGSCPFSQTNNYLQSQNLSIIDWTK